MKLTYKQLIDTLLQTATDHLDIESAHFGEPLDVTKQYNVLYPSAFVEQASISERSGVQETYSVGVQFIDRSFEGGENVLDVLSRMKQTSESFVKRLQNTHPELFTANTLQTYSTVFFTQAYNDRVAGVRLELRLKVDLELNRCELPYA